MPQPLFIRFLQPRGWTVVPENLICVLADNSGKSAHTRSLETSLMSLAELRATQKLALDTSIVRIADDPLGAWRRPCER